MTDLTKNGTLRSRLTRARDHPYTAVRFETQALGQVAQLVEHVTENHGVGGSIPSLAINRIKQLRVALWAARFALYHYSIGLGDLV